MEKNKQHDRNRFRPWCIHVYKHQIIVFVGKAKQVFDGNNWEYADDSIENIFEQGVSVPVQCPIFYPV